MGRKFELQTNHCGLKYLFEHSTLNARKSRLMDFLCEFDLRKKIVELLVEDENYVQIRYKLQQHNLEKKYEVCHLEDDGILTCKKKYSSNVTYLRKIIMDEIH